MKNELIPRTPRRFVSPLLPVSSVVSVLLVGCLLVFGSLTGCSLARTDTPKNIGTDRLCGVWIISDTSISFDNPEGFLENDANYIGFAELTDTVSDKEIDSNVEIDPNGASGSNKGSSSSTPAPAEVPIITRGNIFLSKYMQDTDNSANSTLSVTGALYLSSDKPTNKYMVPIYQRPDGTYYRGTLSATSWYADNRIPTPLTIAATETFTSSEGTARSNKTEITIAFEVRDACTGAKVIEFDKDNLVIKTTALDLDHPIITDDSEDESEYAIMAPPETESVIIEECSGEGASAKIYRTIYCRSEESDSLPVTHILAIPGENEVLIPQKLQISFG